VCSEQDPLAHFKRLQMGILGFFTERDWSQVLPWQQLSRCHCVCFVMYIAGAKLKNTAYIFVELFSIECCAGLVEPFITFLICIIQKIWEKGKCHSSSL